MLGDPEIIAALNEQLTAELTAINQYFLHGKIQANRGWHHLAEHSRHESIEEMKHAETVTERILFLDGLPNYQRLSALRIGATAREMLEADLAVEQEAVTRLRRDIPMCREKGDVTSARLFEVILADEEAHIDFLETELDLLTTLGENLYLLRLTEAPSS